MDRLDELRSIEKNYTLMEEMTFLKAFAGACSAAIENKLSWDACILTGHLAVQKFGADDGKQCKTA